MIQIDKYTKKFQIAIERRNKQQFVGKLDSELRSSEILEQLVDFSHSLDSITKTSDFEGKEKEIISFFNQLYEKITAPGLDAFIIWITSKNTSKNPTNIKEFKKYLKDNYDNYADDIEKIISAKQVIDGIGDTSIFSRLLMNFDNKIKKIITEFIDNNAFENEIDGFLSTLKDEYEKVSEIKELEYTQISMLFTEKQREDETISFYNDIFEVIKKKHQSLEIRKGEDKNTKYSVRINNRISNIKKCITTLVDSGVAKSNDANIKSLFLKFQKEMAVVEDDYLQSLKEFISKEWDSIRTKYEMITDFYSSEPLTFQNRTFDELKKGGDLINLINTYQIIIDEGTINIVPSATKDELKTIINKKSKSIKDLKQDAIRIMSSVNEEFTEFITKYKKQKSMLEKSIENNDALKDDFDAIYGEDGNLDNLQNGINECLSEGCDLLVALSSDAIQQMTSLMKSTTDIFESTLKQTGLTEPIEWLNSLDDFNLSVETLDADKIKLLLGKGLITIKLDKTYN